MVKKKFVFISGQGSNLKNLIYIQENNFPIKISVCISIIIMLLELNMLKNIQYPTFILIPK